MVHCRYTPPGETLPIATAVGSPNYGYRSVVRDLEGQFLIITTNPALRQVRVLKPPGPLCFIPSCTLPIAEAFTDACNMGTSNGTMQSHVIYQDGLRNRLAGPHLLDASQQCEVRLPRNMSN